MKTVDQIKSNLDFIKSECDNLFVEAKKNHKPVKTIMSKYLAKRDFLNQCLMYLETNPRQEFVEKELLRIEGLRDAIDKNFRSAASDYRNMDSEAFKNFKKDFYKNNRYTTITQQYKTLKFLLSDIQLHL